MKTTNQFLALAAFFAIAQNGFGQPTPPSITTQPTSRSPYIDSAATLSVAAAGSPPLRYQWRFNDADLRNESNSSLELLNVTPTNAGPYSVVVSNDAGSVTSQTAWLSVLPTNVVSVGGREFRFGELSAPLWEAALIDDQGPSVTGNGLTLYYSSKAPGGSGGLDLWKVTRPTLSSAWGPPANLGPTINSSGDDVDPTLSPDGLALYFSSNRPGGSGGYDLWVATRPTSDAPFGAPANLGSVINSSADEDLAQISADNRTMVFGSSRPGRLGEVDAWICTRSDAKAPWESAKHLAAPINSSGGTFPVALSRDGLLLFLKSWRPLDPGIGPEPGAIYLSGRASLDQPFSPPVVIRSILGIGSGGADYCSLSADGSTLYVGTYQTLYPDWPQLMQISITPLPQLNAIRSAAPGQFKFQLLGHEGAHYEIQESADLITWQPRLTTNTATSVELSVPASGPGLFYRAVRH